MELGLIAHELAGGVPGGPGEGGRAIVAMVGVEEGFAILEVGAEAAGARAREEGGDGFGQGEPGRLSERPGRCAKAGGQSRRQAACRAWPS